VYFTGSGVLYRPRCTLPAPVYFTGDIVLVHAHQDHATCKKAREGRQVL
jgi:hypothetical protein